MESSHNNAPEPIDLIGILTRFLKVFRRLWLLIPVLAVLFSARSYLADKNSYSPRYECSAIFSVGSQYSSSNIFSSSTFYSDTAAAQTMVETFPSLLSTDYMRDLIIEQLEDGYINGTISSSAFEGTNLIKLSVVSGDAQDAYDILNAVITAYPQAAVYLVDNPGIEMRQEPKVPTAPINAYSPSNSWIRGGVEGAVIGFAIIFCLSLLNQAIGSASELKKLVNIPILATLPQVTVKKRRNTPDTLITAQSNPALTEALRGLRAKVHRQLDASGGKIVLLTSTLPGEGKTTVSANLALSLAAEGHKVVLVDADLRKQSIARLLKPREQNKGLIYCLHNPEHIADCLKEAPNSTLHYISGGVIQKRHYSIDPRALNRVLRTLAQSYDYVVVDTPPCGVVSDTKLLCQHADCVLYVVKADGAHKMLIRDAIDSLHQSGIKLSGCILNSVRRSNQYGYGYGYGYGKKYGYGSKYKAQ